MVDMVPGDSDEDWLGLPQRRSLTRRSILASLAALPASLASCRVFDGDNDDYSVAGHALQRDVERYVGLGIHRTGSPGDLATADWLRSSLDQAGFATNFTEARVRYVTPQRVEVSWDQDNRLGLFPAWPVVTTVPNGVEAVGALVDNPTKPVGDLRGRIAVVDLPFPAYGTLNFGPTRDQIERVLAGAPRGVILLTEGLTGEIIALNSNVSERAFGCPVAYGAPKDAGSLREAAAAGRVLRLVLTADVDPNGTMRSVVGVRAGMGPAVIVSTPISGWFRCGGERGPGIAFWRALARRLPQCLPNRRLVFIANSGHEIDQIGARKALHQAVPPPRQVAVWAHLGAGMATYKWERRSQGLCRIDSGPDPERYLVTGTAAFVGYLEDAFSGQAGLQDPHAVSSEQAFGETRVFLGEGYHRLFGVFASHDLHHTPIDMATSTGPELLAPVAGGLERAIVALASA